jgi:hypothetical protein
MAETSTIAVEVKVNSTNVEKSVGSIKTRLKEARTELTNAIENFGEFSKEAANAAIKVEGLKGTIDDASRLVKAFDGDKKFAAFGSAISTVANGFTAAQGAIGLFGTESAEVESVLKKVNSAMALSQGIDGVLEGVKSFKDLRAVVMSYSIVQKVVTAAQLIFNAVMAANPIGVLVIAITALIAGVVALTSYFMSNAKANRENAKAVKENTKALEEQKKANEKANDELLRGQAYQLAMAKANGASTKAIRALELKLIDEKIATEKLSRETAINTFIKNQNALASLKQTNASDDLIKKQQEVVNESAKFANEQTANLNKSLINRVELQRKHNVEVAAENTAANNNAIQKQKQQSDQALANQKKANDEKLAQDKKNAEDLAKLQEDFKKQREKAAKPTEEDYKAIEEEGERLRKIEEDNEKKRLKTIEDNELFRLQQKKKFAELDTLNDPNNIEKRIAKINADLALELFALEEGDVQRQILAKKAADAIVAIGKEKSKQEIDAEKATADAKKAIQDQSLNVFAQGIQFLQSIFSKSKAVQKASLIAESAVGIAKTIISTRTANAAARATPQAVLTSGAAALPVIALNNISAAIGIAANIAATAKGLSALGGGSAPNVGASLSGGNGSVSAPLAPQAETTTLNQGQINQIGNAAGRAFVVESDITNNQEKIRRLNRQARIN